MAFPSPLFLKRVPAALTTTVATDMDNEPKRPPGDESSTLPYQRRRIIPPGIPGKLFVVCLLCIYGTIVSLMYLFTRLVSP